MPTNEDPSKPEPILSKRRLGRAGVAAFIGCAACCALPLLVAAFASAGGAATAARVVEPGTELVVGAVVFLLVLGGMALQETMKRSRGCGPACRADGRCCTRTEET